MIKTLLFDVETVALLFFSGKEAHGFLFSGKKSYCPFNVEASFFSNKFYLVPYEIWKPQRIQWNIKSQSPFLTEAKLTMETISIYEASKSAFLQAEFGIFFVREFTKTMPSIICQRKILHREFVEIEKFVCGFINS